MVQSLIALSAVLALWALLAQPMQRGRITAPILLVLAGVAIEYGTYHALADILNTHVVEQLAELVLAVLLFVDATDVRGGLFGRDPRSALRLLLIALPLGVATATVLGLWLLPGLSWTVLLVIACVVVSTDFAPASSILRDERLPERVRNLLNVEAGYKDGILSPVLVFALALATDVEDKKSAVDAVGPAISEAVKAVLVGLVVGAALAALANAAEHRNLMTEQSKRIILVAAPVLAWALSVGIGGNGFVSSFVCGIAFQYVRRSPDFRQELELVDDVAVLLTAAMWFVISGIGVLAVMSGGVSIGMVVFALLALTVVRLIPVLIAMLGSTFTWPERLLVGWLGPRGTTSIVFGLLAFNVLDGGAEKQVLLTTVLVVLGSVVLHGLSAPIVARAYARSHARQPGTADEHN